MMLLEIGTGLTFEAGVSIFGVTTLNWSTDGRFVIIGTIEGRVVICECEKEVKENIWDVLTEMRKSIFYWDQWTLGQTSITDEDQGDQNRTLNRQERMDLELTNFMKSTPPSRISDNSFIQYQTLHEAAPLMVHPNPHFKSNEGNFQKKIGRKSRYGREKKIRKLMEKEGSVLFLNRDGRNESYKEKIEKAKRILQAANRLPEREKHLNPHKLKKSATLKNIMNSNDFAQFYKDEIIPEKRIAFEEKKERELKEKEKKQMVRFSSQNQFKNSQNSEFKIKRNVVTLYPTSKLNSSRKSSSRFEGKKNENSRKIGYDNRAKLLYGIHSSHKYKPKRTLYENKIHNYGYSSIPKIDSAMKFNSLIVPRKHEEKKEGEDDSNCKKLLFNFF